MIQQIEFNGYTFTADHASFQEGSGFGLPDIDTAEEAKSQEDGVINTGFKFRGRTFGWAGDLVDDTPALYLAQRQAIMACLLPTTAIGDEMTFTLITGDIRRLKNVRVTDFIADFPAPEPSRTWNSYNIVLRAGFPFFLGDSHSNTQQITEIGGGVVVEAPVPAPLGFGGVNPGIIVNGGNAWAYPVLTITGPGENFTIQNNTTGASMRIETTLLAGEKIIIDTMNQTITKDGANIRGSFDGDFFKLKGGATGATNSISFTAESGSNSDTNLKIEWDDTYLGL